MKRVWSDEKISPALDYEPGRLAAQHPQPSGSKITDSLQPPPPSPIPPTSSPPPQWMLVESSSSSSSDEGFTERPTKRCRIVTYQPTASRRSAPRPTASGSQVTAPSVAAASVSIAQWNVRKVSRATKLMSRIVNWDIGTIRNHSKIGGPNFGRIHYTNLEHWKNDQIKLVKDLIWEKVHIQLKSENLAVPKKFTIQKSKGIRIKASNDYYVKCKCEFEITRRYNGFDLRIGTVLVVNFSSDDEEEKQFLGYITDTERTKKLLSFKMIVAAGHVDALCRSSIVKIAASCNVRKLIQMYDAIHTAQKSNLLRGIINPIFFVPSNQRRDDWMNPENVYTSVVNSYHNGNGFMTLVNGAQDFVERKLFELVKKLVLSNDEISILITGLSVDWMPLILGEMKIYRMQAPFEFKANSFIRFSENDAKKWPLYKNAINSARIVLATVDELPQLNEQRYEEFDTILMNDASQITELEALPALAFNPSSMILFGDENRRPGDRHQLFKNHDDIRFKMKLVYSTMFHRFGHFGRAPH